MSDPVPEPTERELAILEILWERREATVREVYEELRDQLPIVQNTVQAFLRTMTEKRLVSFRREGRTFIYRPAVQRGSTRRRLLDRVLTRVFAGSLDELVASAISLQRPSRDELARLHALLDEAQAREEDRG